MKNKNQTTKERNWDNHIDLSAQTHGGRDKIQAISGPQRYGCSRCDELTRALHGKWVWLSRPQSLYIMPWPNAGVGGAAVSSRHPSSLRSPPPERLAAKGCIGMGGCHGNLNRQSRNEFHHRRSASKLNSTSLTEKRSNGKRLALCHAPESGPCPPCHSGTGSLSPAEPGHRDI